MNLTSYNRGSAFTFSTEVGNLVGPCVALLFTDGDAIPLSTVWKAEKCLPAELGHLLMALVSGWFCEDGLMMT